MFEIIVKMGHQAGHHDSRISRNASAGGQPGGAPSGLPARRAGPPQLDVPKGVSGASDCLPTRSDRISGECHIGADVRGDGAHFPSSPVSVSRVFPIMSSVSKPKRTSARWNVVGHVLIRRVAALPFPYTFAAGAIAGCTELLCLYPLGTFQEAFRGPVY